MGLYIFRREVTVRVVARLDPAQVGDASSNAAVLDAFLEYLIESGIEPYDHQEEASLE